MDVFLSQSWYWLYLILPPPQADQVIQLYLDPSEPPPGQGLHEPTPIPLFTQGALFQFAQEPLSTITAIRFRMEQW
jgi:hypothetical protein